MATISSDTFENRTVIKPDTGVEAIDNFVPENVRDSGSDHILAIEVERIFRTAMNSQDFEILGPERTSILSEDETTIVQEQLAFANWEDRTLVVERNEKGIFRITLNDTNSEINCILLYDPVGIATLAVEDHGERYHMELPTQIANIVLSTFFSSNRKIML